MKKYDTLSEQIQALQKIGYTSNFDLKNDRLKAGEKLELHPDDFVIDQFYRYEGPSDPGDNNILFAISSEKYKIKGLLVNGYGANADVISSEMIKKLDIRGRQESGAVTEADAD